MTNETPPSAGDAARKPLRTRRAEVSLDAALEAAQESAAPVATSAALQAVRLPAVVEAQAAVDAVTRKTAAATANAVATQAVVEGLPTIRGIEAFRSSGIVEVREKFHAAFRSDLHTHSGLGNIVDVLTKVSSTARIGLPAMEWLKEYKSRTDVVSAMGVVDMNAFRGPHLEAMAASFTVAGLHKGLLGGMAANVGVSDTLAKVLASTQQAASTAHAASVSVAWREQMMSAVDTRERLMLKASAAAPTRRLVSARPLTAFDRYLDTLPLTDVPARGSASRAPNRVHDALGASSTHGFGLDALVAADALLSPLTDDDFDEVIEIVRGEVVERWEEARGSIAGDLRERLRAIDPTIADLYVGAWDQFAARGPGHLESASHLANEVLSRVLRTLAPDADVRTWAAAARMPAGEVEVDGKVTRKARLRYIKRNAGRSERSLLVSEVDALSKAAEGLIGHLNAGKHQSVGTVWTLRSNLVTFEAVLLRILD